MNKAITRPVSTRLSTKLPSLGIQLYNHFSSKRDLLTAYIQLSKNLWFTDLDKFLLPIKDPRKKLLALFDYRIDRQMLSNFGGCQFNKIGAELQKSDLDAFDLIKHQKERFKLYIKNLLEQINMLKQNSLDNEMRINALFLIMEGATVSASIYKDTHALENAKVNAQALI